MLNRCEVGHDGTMPYDRLKGKRASLLGGLEFVEALRWKEVGGRRVGGEFRHDLEGCGGSRG